MITRKVPVAWPIGILTLVLLVSCLAYGESAANTSLAFQTIEQGFRSGIQASRTGVIRDEAAWNNLWIAHKRGSLQATTAPVVDFSKEMVVAVFLGSRATGGYSVSVKDISVSESDGTLRVTFEEVRPGSGCIVTQALTSPFQMVRCRLTDGPVFFIHTLAVNNCSAR